MATFHVLKTNVREEFQVIVHAAIPGGNNSANKSWQDIFLAARITGPYAKTRPHSTDPNAAVFNASELIDGENGHSWQIDATEKAALTAGTKTETMFKVTLKTLTLTSLTEMATKTYNEWLAKIQIEYAFFGKVHTL